VLVTDAVVVALSIKETAAGKIAATTGVELLTVNVEDLGLSAEPRLWLSKIYAEYDLLPAVRGAVDVQLGSEDEAAVIPHQVSPVQEVPDTPGVLHTNSFTVSVAVSVSVSDEVA
jgi:hypothetical protein